MPLDLSLWKLIALGLIAMVVFGPDRLPQIARDAGRMLRQVRALAQTARTQLKDELGDTLGDFDVADLNPRTFVRKHLLDDLDPASLDPTAALRTPARAAASLAAAPLAGAVLHAAAPPHQDPLPPGTPAPFDTDAT